jgi:hypothetical protein
MGEVAALSAAFEVETNKALATLPAIGSCPPSEHDAHINHHRAAQRLTELISYYSSRLPPYAYLARIIATGDRLRKQGEHRLALDACFLPVQQAGVHMQAQPRLDARTRLSLHVQACYGVAVCESALVLAADKRIKHSTTLQQLVQCLVRLKEAILLVLPEEPLFWLAYNGTVHIYSLCRTLLTAGLVSHALPFLLLCVQAMDHHASASAAQHLPWRSQLYAMLCYAYCDVQAFDAARQVVAQGLARVDALIQLQRLDPVPPPPDIQSAHAAAKAMLCALKLKLEVQAAPSQPPPAAPVAADAKKGAAAASQVPAADSGTAVLQPLLSQLTITPLFKLAALMEALQVRNSGSGIQV